MKLAKLLPIIALVLLLVGAADPSPVSVITMIGSNPTFNADGSLATAPVQALFQTTVTVDGVPYSKSESVSWDGTSTELVVEVDGIKLTAKQVTTAAALIANYVKATPPKAAPTKTP